MYVVVVDDAEVNNLLMCQALAAVPGCVPRAFTDPTKALEFVSEHAEHIELIVSDYEMPQMNGVDFIRSAKSIPGVEHVPAVLVTSMDQRALRRDALRSGATDFVAKPFDAGEIEARVTNLLELSRARREQEHRAEILAWEVAQAVATVELREQEIITRLARAAENRDTDTGDHIYRVAKYVGIIAAALGESAEWCSTLARASTMHDVGKIAVPDAILLKPGKLTPEERMVMEHHARKGHEILAGSTSTLIQMAAEIALTHHERWDGRGYPSGLCGEDIPLSGRIVAVADVFDALTSARPYKQAWSFEAARNYLAANAGSQFDPRCVEAFLSEWDQVITAAGLPGAAAV